MFQYSQTQKSECAATCTLLDGLLVDKVREKCRFEKFHKEIPKFAYNLRTFGEVGVVLIQKDKKMKQKLKNRGLVMMFVGYCPNHADNVYRMMNLKTRKITKSRDIRWLNKTYGQYISNKQLTDEAEEDAIDDLDDEIIEVKDSKSVMDEKKKENQSYSRPVTRSMVRISEEKNNEPENTRLASEMRNLHTNYNPTLGEVIDFAMVGGTDDLYLNPKSFSEAWNHPDHVEREAWRTAIRKEFGDMIRNNVWRKVKRDMVPKNRRVLGCKWVLKKKKNGVYRARLVAMGFHQIAGVDHQDNFAPVVNKTTFRIVLILSLMMKWKSEIIDIETAFLYGELDEEIFMKNPEGINLVCDERYGPDDVLLLVHAIYGLVQAARQFFKKSRNVLIKEMRFEKCFNDQCLLIRKGENGNVSLMICIYIDDTLVIGTQSAIEEFKKEIKQFFKTKEEGPMNDYVGCLVKKVKDGLILHQSDLIGKLERAFDDEVCKVRSGQLPASTNEGIVVGVDDGIGNLDEKGQTKYRSGIGMLLFLVKYSRPDISNAVRELSKANQNPNPAHYKSLLEAIKFVLETRNKGLFYKRIDDDSMSLHWEIKAYCDSDFAGDKDARKSVSGFCIYVAGCLASWKSHAQKTVTLSSTEAEYVAMSEVCTEILFIKSILDFCGVGVKLPILVNCDNIGAIYLAHNAKTSRRTKHIDVKYHFVREYVEEGIVKVIFVKSEDNDADLWTKNLGYAAYNKHSDKFMTSFVH